MRRIGVLSALVGVLVAVAPTGGALPGGRGGGGPVHTTCGGTNAAGAHRPTGRTRPDLTLATGDGLSMTFSPSGEVVALSDEGRPLPLTPGPVLWVRDMSEAAEVTTPELLSQPGFEDGMTDWQVVEQLDTEVTVTDAVHRSGGSALQMTGSPTGGGLGAGAVSTTTAIPVTPGQRYRLSGYFLSSSGYVRGINGIPPLHQDGMWRGDLQPAGLYVRWADGQGAPVGGLTLVAPLHWNAHDWRRIGGEVRAPEGAAAMTVIVVGRLRDETLWVDDLSVVPSPEHEVAATGRVVPCLGSGGSCLEQVASLPRLGLTLRATYTAGADHIEVHVEAEDTTGGERALEVVWGLPMDLVSGGAAWRWWDDVRHARTIHGGSAADPPPDPFPAGLSWTYEHVVSGVWDGWLPISLYPYALVEDGTDGLALAVSLESPRLVKLAYDQAARRYEARAYLGISPRAVKVGPSADYRVELYRVRPAWGFRAAMETFARHHPQWFESSRSLAGYADYERGYYWSPEGVARVLDDDTQDVFTAEYTVADAPLDIAPVSEPCPTYDDTVARVEELLDSGDRGQRVMAQAILDSVAFSDNGDWQIKRIDEFEWAPGRWQSVWYTSIDPDIVDGWGPFQWNWNIGPTLDATEDAGAVLDGILIDNFLTVPGVDLRPDHLAAADTPLTYDVATYRPGVHNAANHSEFIPWLRQRLEERGRADMVIAINFWGLGTPNSLAPLVDVLGGEGESEENPDLNWNPAILDYRRAIAYHKLQTWTNGEPDLTLDEVEAYVAQALYYGIFPTRKETATGWEAGSDDVLSQAKELQRRYASAGWEPLTFARSNDENVWLERFGGAGNPLGLFFTVYNRTEADRTATLTIDASSLGLTHPATTTLTDLATGETLPATVADDAIQCTITLTAHTTRVIQLTNTTGTRIHPPSP